MHKANLETYWMSTTPSLKDSHTETLYRFKIHGSLVTYIRPTLKANNETLRKVNLIYNRVVVKPPLFNLA